MITPMSPREFMIVNAANRMIGYAATARKSNQPDWMVGLVAEINKWLEMTGDDNRARYDKRDDMIRLEAKR